MEIFSTFKNRQNMSQRFSCDFLEPRHIQNRQFDVKLPRLATLLSTPLRDTVKLRYNALQVTCKERGGKAL